ncbi:alkylated DNA repair protein alkB-like protein 6 [Geosmithia morbida]|uniref:Alkylated DNA repair protein alkB-like protein 6 n=1 Tax=Geosmithia morbida TaxID=1094350 RepID=A0A9P5D476_9HYPO|nr:alkylated DNA repair protein alkB-like protein 6 [Geosmithia morbida]KAF4121219.1 alkylated DNA repair protein alkB-like protein 6 [Geosmithia morbida]
MSRPATVQLPTSLEHARVRGLPPALFYIPDFISEEEERILLDKVAAVPRPRWKHLTHRRLQAWPSELVQNRLLDSPLPTWLEDPVITRLRSIPVSDDASTTHLFEDSPHGRPNHVLINEYSPGDGAAYWPVVCTVSLGASLCLNLYRSKEDGAMEPEPAWRILQEPRSLLITTQDLYTDYLHGISDADEDTGLGQDAIVNWSLLRSPETFANGRNVRETRTSLTYRDVLKVSKVGDKLGLFRRR